jgi:hypothetical protein
MNELTCAILSIREKIQEIARINEAEYGYVHIDFIRAFARLICEEMMTTNCSCRNCPETKQKAQEILKTLE